VKILRLTLIALAVSIVATAASAAIHPFYEAMYQRGLASAENGQHEQALRELRIASFGMVGDTVRYETALVHIALVAEKAGNREESTRAANKIINVERLYPTYAKLQLPASVRAAFETFAPKVIPVDQLALMRSPLEGATAVITGHGTLPPPAPAPPVIRTEKKKPQ
jgi:hypothetical protein